VKYGPFHSALVCFVFVVGDFTLLTVFSYAADVSQIWQRLNSSVDPLGSGENITMPVRQAKFDAITLPSAAAMTAELFPQEIELPLSLSLDLTSFAPGQVRAKFFFQVFPRFPFTFCFLLSSLFRMPALTGLPLTPATS